MKRWNAYITLFVLCIGFAGAWENSFAQDADTMRASLSAEKIMLLSTLWAESGNAAGLQDFDIHKSLGQAFLAYDQSKGDFHRFQEPEENYTGGFYTKGYTRLDRWKFLGSFSYFRGKNKNQSWVDVLEPYNNNPYTLSDAGTGTWYRDFFDMEARAALKLNQRWDLGFEIGYNTGVGARRKDPRPENKSTDFELKPGVAFKKGPFTLGVHLQFETAKEDITIETLTDSLYAYYSFKGLGVFSVSNDADPRSQEAQKIGAGLQLGWENGFFTNLTELSFFENETDIKRGLSKPLQVALVEHFQSDVRSTFLLRNYRKLQNKLAIHYTNRHIFGHEPVVEPQLGEQGFQWKTVAKYVLYRQRQSDFVLLFSRYKLIDKNHFNWGFSAGANYSAGESSYYFVPERNHQKLNLLGLNAAFEKEWLFRDNQLLLAANGRWQTAVKSALELTDVPELLATTNVDFVEHDYYFQQKEQLDWGLRLQMAHTLEMNRQNLQLFLDAGFRWQQSKMQGNPEQNTLHLRLGVNF